MIPLCLGISLPSAKNFLVSDGSVTDKSLFLTWEGVPKADSYKLDVMPPTVGVAGVGNGITDRFSRVLGLEPDMEYTFRLMAMKDGKKRNVLARKLAANVKQRPVQMNQFLALSA